jgi:hypothetical protein
MLCFAGPTSPTPRTRPGRWRGLLPPACGLPRRLEEGARLEAHEAGYEDVGDLGDAGIVAVDVVVEELAAVGDALFEFAEAAPQFHKIFVWP